MLGIYMYLFAQLANFCGRVIYVRTCFLCLLIACELRISKPSGGDNSQSLHIV